MKCELWKPWPNGHTILLLQSAHLLYVALLQNAQTRLGSVSDKFGGRLDL